MIRLATRTSLLYAGRVLAEFPYSDPSQEIYQEKTQLR